MKIATWNVNSIRVRRERLLAWLSTHKPDVLCLQEIKVLDEAFPRDEIVAAGYECHTFGQKTYNGVALLVRRGIEVQDVKRGMLDDVDDPQARLIDAKINGVHVICVYVPNGSEVGSPKYEYKLAWYERLGRYLKTHHHVDEPLVLCGDFNVAPDDRDVAQPEQWKDSVLCHPTMRQALENLVQFGLVDLFRQVQPEGGHYSWWDYRMLAFPKNNGLRIDLVYATPTLAKRCSAVTIDRDERKGEGPSDHVPVMAEFISA